jgi:sodium pump decarboxylase gamma subunit
MHMTLLNATTPSDPAVWFVCLLGVGVVFAGLILLIGIVSLMNLVTSGFTKEQPAKEIPQAPVSTTNTVIENKQEILAAVCAAVAEENGTDISAIRVLSFKKIN